MLPQGSSKLQSLLPVPAYSHRCKGGMVSSEQVKVLRPGKKIPDLPSPVTYWLCDLQASQLSCSSMHMGTMPFSEWNGWNNDNICLGSAILWLETPLM